MSVCVSVFWSKMLLLFLVTMTKTLELRGPDTCDDTQGGGGHGRRPEVEVITEQVSSNSGVICEERQSPLICCLAKRSMMDKESELS